MSITATNSSLDWAVDPCRRLNHGGHRYRAQSREQAAYEGGKKTTIKYLVVCQNSTVSAVSELTFTDIIRLDVLAPPRQRLFLLHCNAVSRRKRTALQHDHMTAKTESGQAGPVAWSSKHSGTAACSLGTRHFLTITALFWSCSNNSVKAGRFDHTFDMSHNLVFKEEPLRASHGTRTKTQIRDSYSKFRSGLCLVNWRHYGITFIMCSGFFLKQIKHGCFLKTSSHENILGEKLSLEFRFLGFSSFSL